SVPLTYGKHCWQAVPADENILMETVSLPCSIVCKVVLRTYENLRFSHRFSYNNLIGNGEAVPTSVPLTYGKHCWQAVPADENILMETVPLPCRFVCKVVLCTYENLRFSHRFSYNNLIGNADILKI
ncbi:MAG: hypothetical protein RR063_05405, partial [Anaerovoracaceae bacterium]